LLKSGNLVRASIQYNFQSDTGWIRDLSLTDAERSRLTIVPLDIRDANLVEDAIKGMDKVVNLAALIGIPYSYMAVESYIQTNLIGTLNVLNASRKHSIRKVIQTSTSEVFGSAQYVPMDEGHPLNAQSPYAATKIASDHLALSYFHSFEVPVTIIRPFNTFGPRQSLRAVIPSIIRQFLTGNKNIFLGDISTTRDFTYVDDTVSGFVKALDSENCIGRQINLGTGIEVSVRQIVDEVAALSGKSDFKIRNDSFRNRPATSEVRRLCADNSLAGELLSWSPNFNGFEGFQKGLKKTFDWFQSNENLAKYPETSFNQ
jgi:NAD dependent epimerase/dehydratase